MGFNSGFKGLISFALQNCVCPLDLPIKILYAFLISSTQFKRYTCRIKPYKAVTVFPSAFRIDVEQQSIYNSLRVKRGPGSVVGIATDYGLGGPGI